MVSALFFTRLWSGLATPPGNPAAVTLPRRPWHRGLWLAIWLLLCLPASALELRIAVRDGSPEVTVGTSDQGTVRNGQGQVVGTTPAGRSLTAQAQGNQVRLGGSQGNAFWLEAGEAGYVFIGDRWYRGRVLVRPEGNGLLAVNYVDIEDYLYSVVGGEMPTSWPLEALKAQAVAARSYVLYHQQRSRHPHYDVGNTTAWQVYRGIADEAPSTRAAVNNTRAQVLTHNGQVIEAVFHSASGGHTENVEDIWSQPRPYLRGVEDFDAGSPVYQWTASFPMAEFSRRIGGVGSLRAALPQRLTPRGRIVEMHLEGNQGARALTGAQLRQALSLRSTLFSIAIEGNTVQVHGRGFGHGIGMSQWGAHNLAQSGRTHTQILGHYYRGAQLAQLRTQP